MIFCCSYGTISPYRVLSIFEQFLPIGYRQAKGYNMQVSLDNGDATYRIKSYHPHAITVNDDPPHQQSFIISPETLITPWEPRHWQQLTPEHFTSILALRPQVVIIGTGSQHHFLPSKLLSNFYHHGLKAEVMSTDAACRTYNLLMAENRHVVAGLIIDAAS